MTWIFASLWALAMLIAYYYREMYYDAKHEIEGLKAERVRTC